MSSTPQVPLIIDGDAPLSLRDSWYAEARQQTAKSLQDFITKLCSYEHDYNTICWAMTAGALAATTVVDKAPSGGITGFQAGAVMWEFIRHFMCLDGPLQLVKFEDLLYPQYASKFDKKLDKETWQWLQDEAKKRLANHATAHEFVKEHWQSIADGKVPHGFTLEGGFP